MGWIYFLIIIVGSCISAVIGLIAALMYLNASVPGEQFYMFAGTVASAVGLAGYLLFIILENLGHIRIEKNVVKNR